MAGERNCSAETQEPTNNRGIAMEPQEKRIGAHVKRETCRFCEGRDLVEILDFGDVPLAGGFLREEDIPAECFYPLSLNLCRDCFLVQVSHVVPGDVLFRDNYFFFSSQIRSLVEHFEAFAAEIHSRFLLGRDRPSVFELGCNDGPLLIPLAALGVRAFGADPATNVVRSIRSKDITVINDFFSEKLARAVRAEHGPFDLFASSYSFAHIDDMIDIMNGVKCLLKDDGVFVFEIYYLGTLIDELQYDMIYHEHMSYYSLRALTAFLKRFGMEVFDVRFIPGIRSGSVRFYARNIGKRPEPVTDAVRNMMDYEARRGFDRVETYRRYAQQIAGTRSRLLEILDRLKGEGRRIIGYGASGRGTVIMNYCGIDRRYVDCVVDDAPAKHGFYTPGTHVPITSWEAVHRSAPPDYAVLFAWAFTDEVLRKRKDYMDRGGKFIIPLPRVKVFPE